MAGGASLSLCVDLLNLGQSGPEIAATPIRRLRRSVLFLEIVDDVASLLVDPSGLVNLTVSMIFLPVGIDE